MPSDLAYWIVSAPSPGGDDEQLFNTIKTSVGDDTVVGGVDLPLFKAGTLSSLLTLSDSLPKTDAYFTTTLVKILDTIKNLVGDDKEKVGAYVKVNDVSTPESYVLPAPSSLSKSWTWDKGRWGEGGKVGEVIDALNKEMVSIATLQQQSLSSYNLAKQTLIALQRKRTGNLSTKSLVDVVKDGDLVTDSEWLEGLLVVVPNALVKDWNEKYERLASMVVPRSSQQLAADNDFTLMSVTVFKKVKDEFIHKCRENKFTVRDFTYDSDALDKQKKELDEAAVEERELWSDLLRLSRTNFSEAYQLLMHLKVVRVFVESVLRYGLPAEYSVVVVRPTPKTALKTLKTLSSNRLLQNSDKTQRNQEKKGKSSNSDDVGGEWGAVMDQEYFDFVLFELPIVII